jgi:hypothetical protein
MDVDEDWQKPKEEEYPEEWPRTDEEEEDEPYVQSWEENLQNKSEAWAKPAGRPERYAEVKYDEKIGKKMCRFFQKGHCKKGKNCNFVHEDRQVPPEGATEEPKTWGQIWEEKPKVWTKVQEQKKHWKHEYEEVEQPYQYQKHYKKGKDYNVGSADYGDYYNMSNKNKYQEHVSGSASYGRQDYSSSSAPPKHFKSKW